MFHLNPMSGPGSYFVRLQTYLKVTNGISTCPSLNMFLLSFKPAQVEEGKIRKGCLHFLSSLPSGTVRRMWLELLCPASEWKIKGDLNTEA